MKRGAAITYGRKVLPTELMQFQGQRKKYHPEEVLPVERLVEWRERGRSFHWIAQQTGLSKFVVARYAARVLPEELRGKRGKYFGKKRKAARPRRPRCARCTFLEEPDNPVDWETGLCLCCRAMEAGYDLLKLHESGEWKALLEAEHG